MRLRIGHVPPLFARRDLSGRQINLARYAGRWVLLSFYRAAACPLCSLRM
jgi:thioredoxin-dependent peroxiredoxin